MNHKAIYALYPQVLTIDGEAGAFDEQGNKVKIDLATVNAWVDSEAYKYKRQVAYAPLAEQLDMQYHDTMNGTETWLDHIRSVKEAHPKEGE